MKLDPTNHDLCYDKLENLRPRWGGTIPKMIDFGRECTANTNWGGTVRLMLAEAHYEASQEIHDAAERSAYWRKPEVWSDVQFTYEQFFKLYPNAVSSRQSYARFAFWCGHWAEFLDQVKMFSNTNYVYFGGEPRFNKMLEMAKSHVKN